MVELTIACEVELARDTNRGCISDVVDRIGGSTKGALSRILGLYIYVMRGSPVVTVGLLGCTRLYD